MTGGVEPSDREELKAIWGAVPQPDCIPQKRFIAFCDVLGFRDLVMTRSTVNHTHRAI